MKNNKLTMSQALKIYRGSGLVKQILILLAIMIGVTVLIFGSFIPMTAYMYRGWDSAFEHINNSSGIQFPLVFATLVTVAPIAFTFEKNQPGGKYFRSVKGGFEAYKKMRTATLAVSVISIIIFSAVLYFMDSLLPIAVYGPSVCISMVICYLFTLGIVNFLYLIIPGNTVFRTILQSQLAFIIPSFGLSVVLSFEKDNNIHFAVYIAAIAVAVLLLLLSHKLMLDKVKKCNWDS